MSKPKRFDRIVEQQVRTDKRIGAISQESAARLLRAEHSAVIRLVKHEITVSEAGIKAIVDGYCARDINRPAEIQAIRREARRLKEVLDLLTRRVK